MKKSISAFLLATIVLQSCVVYQNRPVPLNQAVNKGKVKVITTTGTEFNFNHIYEVQGTYYGLMAKSDSIRFSAEQVSEVYQQKAYLYQVWIKLIDQKSYRKGVLYELHDSSIVVSNSLNIDDYSNGDFEGNEYQITDIAIIKIRRKNRVWQGMTFGAITGIVVGGTFVASSNDSFAVVMFLFTVPIGTGIGAMIGSNPKSFILDGAYNNYQSIKGQLIEYSIIK